MSEQIMEEGLFAPEHHNRQRKHYTSVAERLRVGANTQQELFTTLKNVVVGDIGRHAVVMEITYPSGAATVTIPAGTTELDLWTGAVHMGDGSTDYLNVSLVQLGAAFIRSLYVDVTKEYTVEIDGKADHAMAADNALTLRGIACTRIAVTVSEVAQSKFWGSTNPNARMHTTKSLVAASADELRLITNYPLRSSSPYDSNIALCSSYNIVVFYVSNGMDEDVSARVYGNRVNSVTGAVTIGDSLNVAAGDAIKKAVATTITGLLPYLFVRLTASAVPSAGVVNVYAICRYNS